MAVDPQNPDSALLEVRRAHSMKALADLRDILDIVLLAGKLLLESGAETWRVEETIHRLGRGLDADSMETYATPTGIIVSGMEGGESRASIVRVTNLSVDLRRIGAVLDLVRRSDKRNLTRKDANTELERIARTPRAYSTWLTVTPMIIAGACYGGLNAINVAMSTAALASGIGGLGAAARAFRQHHETAFK